MIQMLYRPSYLPTILGAGNEICLVQPFKIRVFIGFANFLSLYNSNFVYIRDKTLHKPKK